MEQKRTDREIIEKINLTINAALVLQLGFAGTLILGMWFGFF